MMETADASATMDSTLLPNEKNQRNREALFLEDDYILEMIHEIELPVLEEKVNSLNLSPFQKSKHLGNPSQYPCSTESSIKR